VPSQRGTHVGLSETALADLDQAIANEVADELDQLRNEDGTDAALADRISRRVRDRLRGLAATRPTPSRRRRRHPGRPDGLTAAAAVAAEPRAASPASPRRAPRGAGGARLEAA
jgi:hypothetical protein